MEYKRMIVKRKPAKLIIYSYIYLLLIAAIVTLAFRLDSESYNEIRLVLAIPILIASISLSYAISKELHLYAESRTDNAQQSIIDNLEIPNVGYAKKIAFNNRHNITSVYLIIYT